MADRSADRPPEVEQAPKREDESPAPSKTLEITVAAVCLVLAAAFLVLALQIEVRREAAPGQIDARFWPSVIGWIAVALAGARLVVACSTQPDARDDLERVGSGGPARLGVTVALTLVYLLVWNVDHVIVAGYRYEVFPVATVALLGALLFVYGHRGWKGLIIFPLATTAFIYLLFGELLRIPL